MTTLLKLGLLKISLCAIVLSFHPTTAARPCSTSDDCDGSDVCERGYCIPKPRVASDCNPGRKEPPPREKEQDRRDEKVPYNPKV